MLRMSFLAFATPGLETVSLRWPRLASCCDSCLVLLQLHVCGAALLACTLASALPAAQLVPNLT